MAFGGAPRWTLVPLIIASALLIATVRPSPLRFPYGFLDVVLLVCLLVPALQLVPIPPDLRQRLTPGAALVERALLFNVETHAAPRPITLDAVSTGWALAFGAVLLVVFWSARATFERGGGLRRVIRGIAWIGLLLAGIMFVQRATTPGLIYGLWQPVTRASHPTPLGPFVNRNDIATWLILAAPLVFGYAVAHVESHGGTARAGNPDEPQQSGPTSRFLVISTLTDARTLWLAASVCLMMAALMASLSRSGLFGGAVGLAVFTALSRRRVPGKQIGWLLLATAALIAIASIYANVSALLERISYTVPSNLGGRLVVWRETWPMARDFVLTGLGVGAFERGMLVYQKSTRLIFFNHAHNEYLQLLVEGGLLLAIPATLAVIAAWWSAHRRIAEDTTAIFWIRTGAASGLVAVAAQSFWDTGLRMPANAVLFAIVAAIAVHDPAKRENAAKGMM